jgi:predicted site-specific integrase-resolvase
VPKMLTPEQVATMYEVDANTVRRWCARGLLPGAVKEGSKYRGYWLIPESALEGFKPPKPGPKRGR